MPRGGARSRTNTQKVKGTRKWFRSICEAPELREQVERVIRASVANGDLTDYWKAIEHGFGRAPQALDVKVSGDEAKPVRHIIALQDGNTLPASIASLPTTSSGEPGS